eukprot:m.465528 g.465528  ORF g.465528 m.465528 type:complete len:106 (-) comp24312_c0_seq1:211-528(-)
MWRRATSTTRLCVGLRSHQQIRIARQLSSDKGATAPFYAVIRWDNNVATVPFVGSSEGAEALAARMTSQQHKHHIFIRKVSEGQIPPGPYRSLEEIPHLMAADEH